jgi:hypothetical protein
MSGISAVNFAAASTISGGDPQLQQLLAGSFQLIHVLQVYTSSMVRFPLIQANFWFVDLFLDGPCGLGLDSVCSK